MNKFRQILLSPEWWLVIIPLIAYRQIAFFQHTMQWDMTDQAFVWHRFISECFHQHILPLWCPYSRFGYPFFADPQSGLFYPPTWFFTYFFDYTLYTNNCEFIFHVIAAAFAMRFLLVTFQVGRFTACTFGLVYALSGPFVSNATHISFICSLCWLPFVLGSYIRLLKTTEYCYALLTALFLYLQLSGGYVGISIILFYVMSFICLYYLIYIFPLLLHKRKFIRSHMLLGVVTVLLSVGFIYAVSKGLPYIDRRDGISREMANSIAFTPPCLLTLFYPGIADSDFVHFGTDLTMRNLYMGALTLILIMISLFRPRRVKWIVLGGSILSLLMAMGDHTPLRGWLYSYVPLMNLFRMAAIFRFFSCIGFVALAAFGFDEIFEKSYQVSLAALKNFIGIAALLLLTILSFILVEKNPSLHYPDLSSLIVFSDYLKHTDKWSTVFLQSCIDITALGIALFALIYFKENLRLQKYFFAGLVLLDMGIAVQGNVFSTVANPKTVADVQCNIEKLPKGFPIISNDKLGAYSEWNDTSLAPPIWHSAGFLQKHITFDGNNSYNLIAYNQLADRKDFYQLLSQRKIISTQPESMGIVIKRFYPGRILFDINSDKDATVYIGQLYFPGWTSSIDGGVKQAIGIEANTNFMSCHIPAGHHMVNLVFAPTAIDAVFSYTVVIFVFMSMCTLLFFLKPVIL
jgi:hypothetical protein